MTEKSEVSAETMAVCASVLAGVSRGWFLDGDYKAIWDLLPRDTRKDVLEMIAATRVENESLIRDFEENNS